MFHLLKQANESAKNGAYILSEVFPTISFFIDVVTFFRMLYLTSLYFYWKCKFFSVLFDEEIIFDCYSYFIRLFRCIE